MKHKKLLTSMTFALGLGMGSAQALTVNQILSLTPNFQFEDDNIEWLVEPGDLQNGLLNPGDQLQGVIEFPDIKGFGADVGEEYSMDGVTNSHLAAVFTAEVFSISNVVDIGGGVLVADFVFAPVGSFAAGSILQGSMIDVYEDNTDDVNIFDCAATRAACMDLVTNGTKILEIGMTGDVDEAWEAFGSPVNPDLTAFETTEFFGSFNYALGTVSSTIGIFSEIRPVAVQLSTSGDGNGNDLTEWKGSGSPGGALGVSLADATSDAQLSATRIPEPGSLLLLGAGLLGLLGIRSRRRS